MKKLLRKLFATLILAAFLCTQAASALGGELPSLDFSDRNYLLPVDFAILDQRAIEENYTENGYQDSTIAVVIESGRFEDRCDYWYFPATAAVFLVYFREKTKNWYRGIKENDESNFFRNNDAAF